MQSDWTRFSPGRPHADQLPQHDERLLKISACPHPNSMALPWLEDPTRLVAVPETGFALRRWLGRLFQAGIRR